ncbi:MAG: serine/threonine-protein phosphatase [Leptospiraceae bacterium]|nr:serine/threonine-protein phosphatase [Leptospiraceae bacterium]MDW8306582.1 PP2C family protein-serine/threonine phosphatase [Leptospiraceae bacterium]
MSLSLREIQDKQLQLAVPLVGGLIIFALLFFILADLGFPSAPHHELFKFRMQMAALFALLVLFSLTRWGKKPASLRLLAILLPVLCGFSVSWLTHLTGGSQSPYWTMIMLTYFGGTLILRLNVWEAAASYLVVFGVHLWVILMIGRESYATPYFFTSFFGIALALVVSLTGNWYITRLEYKRHLAQQQEERKKEELQKQLTMAGELQQSLLPEPIYDPRVEVSYLYHPCAAVGGDLIDCRFLKTDSLGLFICDVSGHGVAAALLASMVKVSLQQWSRYADSPSRFLNYLQHEMGHILQKNFLTAMSIHVDLISGKALLASAGHLPAIVHSSSGDLRQINSRGTMVCSVFPTNCVDYDFELSAGDTLFLYTDGIVELRNREGEMFDEERFFSFLQKEAQKLSEFKIRLLGELQKFWGRSDEDFPDDISLLAFRFKPREFWVHP